MLSGIPCPLGIQLILVNDDDFEMYGLQTLFSFCISSHMFHANAYLLAVFWKNKMLVYVYNLFG